MKSTSTDLQLLADLLESPEKHWRRFVDRYASTVIQVVQHCRQSQKWNLTSKDVDDVVVAVFERLADDNLGIVHRFDDSASFTTFLTLAARRVVIQELQDRGADLRIQSALREASSERLQIPGTA